LHQAIYYENVPRVKELLEQHEDPNRKAFQQTPLYLACYNTNVEIVKLLLNHGADPSVTSGYPRIQNDTPSELVSYMLGECNLSSLQRSGLNSILKVFNGEL